MSRKYSYEDEKRDAINSWLSDKPWLKEEMSHREINLKLMQIKTDIQLIGRLAIVNFIKSCDKILKEQK